MTENIQHQPITLFLAPVLARSSIYRPLPFLSYLVHIVVITVKRCCLYPLHLVAIPFFHSAHTSSFTLFFLSWSNN
ncbi:MAG: hypothetical protein JOS17DRAFT_726401 [Linnemannia elongata]|nr:MAG: hypothetical protein JOS17DRAFT_726401 [Linnemannia elongata]